MAQRDDHQGWRQHVINNMLPRMEATGGQIPIPANNSLTPGPVSTGVDQVPFSVGMPSQPQFDPLELLPERAQDLLRKLRQRREDAHALNIPFADIQEASTARIQAEQRLKQLQAPAGEGGHSLPVDDRRVIEQQRTLDKATADFERLKQLQEVRSAAWQTASAALTNVEAWLKSGRPGGTELQAVEVAEPTLNKGETVLDGIDRLRRRGRELKAARHTIESSPYPSSHAKAQMRTQVEALAMQGTPDVSMIVEHDASLIWPTTRLTSEVHAQVRSLAFTEITDATALIAFMFKDQLIAKLDALIADESDDAAALSHADRELRTAEVMGDLLAVERDESALVWLAQSQSLPVEHRADCDACAILQIRLVTAPLADVPDTTPGHHAYDLIGGRGRRR